MVPSPLVLASASPRRRALLEAAGVAFEVEPADVDESLDGAPEPEAAAALLARRKAEVVAARRAGAALVLGADTIVAVPDGRGGWRLLGKPTDADEARGMLRALSGTEHRVCTGVCVVRTLDGARFDEVETTLVRMRGIAPEELEAYVASGEWRDKAGGYAIQEHADAFVEGLAGGGFDNVVGLPVERTLRLLAAAGLAGAGEGR